MAQTNRVAAWSHEALGSAKLSERIATDQEGDDGEACEESLEGLRRSQDEKRSNDHETCYRQEAAHLFQAGVKHWCVREACDH